MIRALSCFIVSLLVMQSHEQSNTPTSPCPNVFMYEPSSTEPGRWYGVVNLSTDSTLHSLWLNIVLDSKADILGNWVGDVTTTDNIDFKIENTKMKIHPGPAQAVRFFVQYSPQNKAPKLQAIRLNGREICNANIGVATDTTDDRDSVRPSRPETTVIPVSRPDSTVSRPSSRPTRPVEDDRPVVRPEDSRPVVRPDDSRPLERPDDRPVVRPSDERPVSRPDNSRPVVRPEERPVVRPDDRPVVRPSESRPVVRPDDRPVVRPSDSRPVVRPDDRPVVRPDDMLVDRPVVIRPEDRPQTRPVHGRPSGDGPVYVPTPNPPIEQSNVNPYSIDNSQLPSQSVGTQTGSGSGSRTTRPSYQITTAIPLRTTTTRRRDPDDFDTSDSRPDPDEYFNGGQPTFIVPSNPSGGTSSNHFYTGDSNSRRPPECGTVLRNNPNPLVVNGKATLEGQWPWQIALYQTQTVDNKYICGGTLVSRQHVITAAHCVTRKGSSRVVNKNTLTVYLGKHNLRTSVEGVQIRLVSNIAVHPQYNASSFSRDLAILTLREPVSFTDFVRPACIWPENEVDLSNVIGQKGSVVGWGFDNTGVATEELTLVEMPVVDQETCIRSYSEFFARFTSEYTFCAGFRDGTSVCNGDSGGGMVFNKHNIWYLRGLVSLSVARQNEYRCDPSHYVVFTDLAKFLPWIKQHVEFN